jgi:hypothetical protein
VSAAASSGSTRHSACAFRRRPVANAEELPQQQILDVHGAVGLELALPASFEVLEREEVRPCSLQRDDFTRGGRDTLDDPRRSRYLAGERHISLLANRT